MWKKLCGLVLVINIVYVILGVAKYGSQHVDAYGIWMLKAKAWLVEGGLPMKLLHDPDYGYSHQQYPLLLPAMMAGWARIFGSVESFVWVYPLVYGGVLIVIYQLTQSWGWTAAASFMGPLMAQGGRGHAGLADIWLTLLVGLGLLAVKYKKLGELAVIVMIASQIKTEGIFLLALFGGGQLSWREKWPWMLLATLPFFWWQWQVRVWGLPSDIGLVWPGVIQLGVRFGEIVSGVVKEMVNWRNWYVVWGLWWVSFGQNANWKFQMNEMKILGLVISGFMGVYLFSSVDAATYVSSSIDRMMLQWLPLWWIMLHSNLKVLEREPLKVFGLIRRILK